MGNNNLEKCKVFEVKDYKGDIFLCFSKGIALDIGNGIICESYLNYKQDSIFDDKLKAIKFVVQNPNYDGAIYHMKEWYMEDCVPDDLKSKVEDKFTDDDGKMYVVIDKWKAKVEDKIYKEFLLPSTIKLGYTKDGRVMGRVHNKPNLTGLNCKGKPVFPDKHCKNVLWEGQAIVTKLTDKGTYAFVECKMNLDVPQDFEEVSDYIWELYRSGKIILYKLNIPGYGTYYARQESTNYDMSNDKERYLNVSLFTKDKLSSKKGSVYCSIKTSLFESFTVESFDLGEYWLKESFSKDTTRESICSRINKCQYVICENNNDFKATLDDMSIIGYNIEVPNDIVDEMFHDKIVMIIGFRYKTLRDMYYYFFNYNQVHKLSGYAPEELDEAVDFINKNNKRIEDMITHYRIKNN